MADPTLTTGQYSIGLPGSGTALIYGGRYPAFANSTQVRDTQYDQGQITAQDVQVVGHDGTLFGVDTFGGMLVSQSGQVIVPGNGAAAMDAFNTLAAVWNDPAIRLLNDKVVVLRAFYPGSSVVRRAYGRGRSIVPAHGLVNQGIVPWTATFQASDSTWYSDTLKSLLLTMVPSVRGGHVPPAAPPFVLSQTTNFQQGTATNTGSLPTWPVFTITGPVTTPGIKYPNVPVTLGYNGTLGSSDTLVIDTRPWERTAKLNGSNVAGKLTGDPMIALLLQAGGTLVRFTGQDFVGTATMTVSWRNAFQVIGGTTT